MLAEFPEDDGHAVRRRPVADGGGAAVDFSPDVLAPFALFESLAGIA